MNVKNAWVSPGGVTRHTLPPSLAEAGRRGLAFELFSPLRSDLCPSVAATWHPIVPGTDTAVMLALAYVIVTEGRARHRVPRPLLRRRRPVDRVRARRRRRRAEDRRSGPSAISGIPPATIRELARRMATHRTMVTVSWALQRTRHGEQPVWMGIALAALLGQIGLPGGGFGHGYGSMADVGAPPCPVSAPHVRAGPDPRRRRTSRSRASPSCSRTRAARSTTTGTSCRLPDIRVVYWAGGNPFHHHQDLNRLRRALGSSRHGRSCTIRSGRRPRATPTSCCRSPRRSNATTSGAAATTAT